MLVYNSERLLTPKKLTKQAQSWFNATKFNFKICNETEVVQTIKNNQIKSNDEIELIDFEADSFSCSKFRTTNVSIKKIVLKAKYHPYLQ